MIDYLKQFKEKYFAKTPYVSGVKEDMEELMRNRDNNAIEDFDYDYYIYNDSDLDTLQWKAEQFIKMIKEKYLKKDEK